MNSLPGREPVIKTFRVLAILAGMFVASDAAADLRVVLTMSAAEDLALQNEPGQLAMRARAEALQERSIAAGQLPDPALRVGLANFPISSGGFSTEGMTQAQLGYRQSFPRKQVRELRTDRLEYLAEDVNAGAEARARDVLAAARADWLDYFYAQRALELLHQSRPFFEDLITTTRSFYAVGRKSQFDVLQAELELQRLDDRIIEAGRVRTAAQAALSQWLGEDAYRPVPDVMPQWDAVPTLHALQSSLLTHPLLASAAARVDAEQSAVDLANASKKSGWTLDVGYGYREGELNNGEPRSVFISVSMSVGLPFFTENRQDRDLAAALADRTAARESRRQLLARLNSELLAEHARWSDLSRRTELYETQILKVSAASAEAALRAYQSDTTDFADVLRGSLSDLDTRLEYVRLRVERAKSFATLANLGGMSR